MNFYTDPKGATSLNGVTTTTNGAMVPGNNAFKTTALLVTGAGVNAGLAILQVSHDPTFPGAPQVIEQIDLSVLGANQTQARSYQEVYPYWRWITTGGAHGGTVSGYIQVII